MPAKRCLATSKCKLKNCEYSICLILVYEFNVIEFSMSCYQSFFNSVWKTFVDVVDVILLLILNVSKNALH